MLKQLLSIQQLVCTVAQNNEAGMDFCQIAGKLSDKTGTKQVQNTGQ
jgi:hypothetical protein